MNGIITIQNDRFKTIPYQYTLMDNHSYNNYKIFCGHFYYGLIFFILILRDVEDAVPYG